MPHLRPQIVAAASRRLRGESPSALKRGWRTAAVIASVAAVCCVVASPAASKFDEAPTVVLPLQRSIMAELNAVRRQHGLRSLRVAAGLAAAARQHSLEMARLGYFGHGSAGGVPFGRRITRFYPMGKRHHWTVGENLYWSSGEPDAYAAVEAWLESPEHRVILLSRDWREFGIAAVFVRAGPGAYGGRDVTIVTADFGARD
jgi:uncharacterized protein YkwD